jgi:type IV secretory pathway VirB2 component (pilin)
MEKAKMQKTDGIVIKKSGREEAKEWAASFVIAVGLGFLFMSGPALAQSDELGDGICKVVNFLTGKWLFGFAILATAGGMARLYFGGEITDSLKTVATIITGIGITLGMSGLLSLAFTKFSSATCS